ncbi:recombinase family protein [bacterium]|nr:recombinase family protein [bacterium]
MRVKLDDEIPFGWKRRNGVLIKNDLEQWVIKRIRDEKLAGKSLDEITQDLTKIGIKPRNGGFWFPRRIKKVLSENESLGQSVIQEAEVTAEKKMDKPESKVSDLVSLPSEEPPKKTNRAGVIEYEIKESCQTIEKCESEAAQRSLEIGKIITRALLFAVAGKRRKEQLMGASGDELQDRNLCEGEH